MRKLITGMKLSLDGKIEGAEGYADWVEAWSEDYGLDAASGRVRGWRRHVPRLRAVLDRDTE
jgi:hypothetical protein